MKTIGLIAAMPQEVRPLLKRVGKWQAARVGAYPGYRFRVAGRDCLLVRSGVGQRNAAQAARALLAVVKPEILVSFGIAGAVETDLRIGDVVLGSSVYLLGTGLPDQEIPLAALTAAVYQEISIFLSPRRTHLYTGTILTTSGSQLILDRTKNLPHPVLEMETHAIAEAAAVQGVPLLGLRSISDNPEAPIPFPIEEMYAADYRLRIGWVLLTILRRPALLPSLVQLWRNSEIAAENAASLVMAVLSQSFSR